MWRSQSKAIELVGGKGGGRGKVGGKGGEEGGRWQVRVVGSRRRRGGGGVVDCMRVGSVTLEFVWAGRGGRGGETGEGSGGGRGGAEGAGTASDSFARRTRRGIVIMGGVGREE